MITFLRVVLRMMSMRKILIKMTATIFRFLALFAKLTKRPVKLKDYEVGFQPHRANIALVYLT